MIIYCVKDVYGNRRLPHLIGTAEFLHDETLGLLELPSDDDEEGAVEGSKEHSEESSEKVSDHDSDQDSDQDSEEDSEGDQSVTILFFLSLNQQTIPVYAMSIPF